MKVDPEEEYVALQSRDVSLSLSREGECVLGFNKEEGILPKT